MARVIIPLNRMQYHVEHSLRARAIVTILALSLLVAFGFASVSLISVRSTLQEQAKTQVQSDFIGAVRDAQSILASATVTNNSASQRLITSLASTLQNSSAENLLAVHIEEESTYGSLAPVSTDPSYIRTISSQLDNTLGTCLQECILFQPVNTAREGNNPGAVLASVITMPNGVRLHLFSIYSFDAQQRSVVTIQRALLVACLIMTCAMAILAWQLISSMITPISHVATAASQLAQGALETRVEHNRMDEIGVLQVSFNDMASSLERTFDELEALSAMQQRFVSDVSHELRTPVTTIRMASDLLMSHKQSFDAPTERTIELLDEQTQRFQSMLADLLEISRYDAGSTHLEVSCLDVRSAIEQAINDIKPLADIKKIEVRKIIPEHELMIYADGPRITRIARNLLGNAIDFANGKPIEVAVADNDFAWAFAVCDHGSGMSSDDVSHIFERFWRADISRSRLTGGTGLGLSIAQLDAQIHHGSIDVHSVLDEGTCFIVTFPKTNNTHAQSDELVNEQLDQHILSDKTTHINASYEYAPIRFSTDHVGFTLVKLGEDFE